MLGFSDDRSHDEGILSDVVARGMDDRALKGWVGDQLHALLGYSEGALAAFVVGLGASAPAARRDLVLLLLLLLLRFD